MPRLVDSCVIDSAAMANIRRENPTATRATKKIPWTGDIEATIIVTPNTTAAKTMERSRSVVRWVE